MATSDRIYRSFLSSIKFFSKGWGPIETYESLAEIFSCLDVNRCSQMMLQCRTPVSMEKTGDSSDSTIYSGSFASPLSTLYPHIMPPETTTARFELIVPKRWATSYRPFYIHMAGTGDHFFWRRRYLFAYPLLRLAGIGTLMLENPFYGSRKPTYQTRSQLHHVSDLFVMGLALILESMTVARWLEQQGLGPIGLTGVSMGGHNASLAASLWPKPIPVVPCLSWCSASCGFVEGALSEAVCWDTLQEQLFHSKIGLNERMRDIFNIIVQRYCATDSNIADNSLRILSKSDMAKDLPKTTSKGKPTAETVSIMRCMLDYATHLHNYPTPHQPDLAVFVSAKNDLYISKCGGDVRQLWPGCEVREIDGGHVTSQILQRTRMLEAQVSAINRVMQI